VSGHVFVDETKHRGYLLVASAVPHGDLDPLRKLIRGLILPGQRRLHMKNENDQRKRSITAAITNSDVRATIYTAERRYRTERDSRAACLQALVADIATRGDTILVLEQDDSLIPWDRRHLYDLARQSGCAETLRYQHQRASAEILLAIPDAIAWCWAKGGDWQRRVEPVVADVQRV